MSTDTLDFSNLEKNSLQMLQKFAKESLHIRSVTTYRKPQLIELIQKKLQTESQKQKKEAACPALLRKTTLPPDIRSAIIRIFTSGIPKSSPNMRNWQFSPPIPLTFPSPALRQKCSTTPVFSRRLPGFPFPFWAGPFTTAPSGRI